MTFFGPFVGGCSVSVAGSGQEQCLSGVHLVVSGHVVCGLSLP